MELEGLLTIDQMKSEASERAHETKTLIFSYRRLIEYFGTVAERADWDAAMAIPSLYLEFVIDTLMNEVRTRDEPRGRDVAFNCSEAIAAMISPLVQLIAEPVAEFVYTVRETYPPERQKNLLYPYGIFCSRFAQAVSDPLWKQFPRLAPEEWRAAALKPTDSEPAS